MNKTIGPVLNPLEDFKAKLGEKVRSEIANLLPESVITSLIEEVVKQEFLLPIQVKGEYGRTHEQSSWFVKEVTEAVRPMMQKAIQECVNSHKDEIEKVIKDCVSKESLMIIFAERLATHVGNNIQNNLDQILSRQRY